MEFEEESKDLDLTTPEDAREFLEHALARVFPNGERITHIDFKDGRRVAIADLTDSEAMQAAQSFVPLYEEQFPDQVHYDYLH